MTTTTTDNTAYLYTLKNQSRFTLVGYEFILCKKIAHSEAGKIIVKIEGKPQSTYIEMCPYTIILTINPSK